MPRRRGIDTHVAVRTVSRLLNLERDISAVRNIEQRRRREMGLPRIRRRLLTTRERTAVAVPHRRAAIVEPSPRHLTVRAGGRVAVPALPAIKQDTRSPTRIVLHRVISRVQRKVRVAVSALS